METLTMCCSRCTTERQELHSNCSVMTMDPKSIVITNTSGPVTNLQSPEENVMATVNQLLVSSVTVYQRYFHVPDYY